MCLVDEVLGWESMASLHGHINFLSISTVSFITKDIIDGMHLSEVHPGSQSLAINIQSLMNQAVLLVFRKGEKNIPEGPDSQLTSNLSLKYYEIDVTGWGFVHL